MAIRRNELVLIVLLALVGASVWRTVSVEQDKRRLGKAYEDAQQAIQELSTERAHLNEELTSARATVEDQAGNLANFQQELAGVQARLDRTLGDIAALQQEHEALRQTNATLSVQMASLAAEKQELQAKLSNLRELKLAIREVKQKISAERWASWRARAEAQRRADEEQLASGNRGFVVRNGVSTLGEAPRLHVHVLEPQAAQ